MITGSTLGRTVDNNEFRIDGGTGWDKGASLSLSGKDRPDLGLAGAVILRASDGSQSKAMTLYPDGTFMLDNKNIAMAEDVIPRIGGEVFDASIYARNIDNSEVIFYGGRGSGHGGNIFLAGKDNPGITGGVVGIRPDNSTNMHSMWFSPDGSLSWDGQPIQYGSDQRLKQQISKIDNALLDAWEDVLPCQFKYNDAVEQKGDTARLHTGYVVQQIDEACKSHNLDISAYGLYCHEEYPERTEEVTIENEDGTTKKETKVIEEASEHYSLRYTETLVVECAYLRRENARLKERLQQHDDYFSNIEKRLQSLENS